ncbi:sensor histidine kinase [Sphaerisporangium rhizosphaerae]|uniref:Oxygen sensor histidine kinase NreB n=1 Tax=Sphaerisporangium rhizosphaerae TaxID=2269375 RepID=A0ABW2P5P1_9ACTN
MTRRTLTGLLPTRPGGPPPDRLTMPLPGGPVDTSPGRPVDTSPGGRAVTAPGGPAVTAGPRPGASGGANGPVANAWQILRGWEALYLLAFVVTLALVIMDRRAGDAAKAVAIGSLCACAVAYVLVGRRALKAQRHYGRFGLLYAGFAIVTFVPATVIAPPSTFALFALCPQMFMALPVRWAVTTVLLLNTAPAIRFVMTPGVRMDDLVGFVASGVVAAVFSIIAGRWITRIVNQSADRAELIEELSASRAEVERLSRERGALAERERLAGDIHDTLAQGFTSIIMLLQAAEAQPDPSRHLALAMRTAQEGLDEARGLITVLRPPPLDGSSLEEALSRIASRVGEELGIPLSFGVEGRSRALPPGAEVVLIRAAQEGLANVRKHAGAASASLGLTYLDQEVVLRVSDDGAGFDGLSPSAGFGLRAMRGRVEQAGGTVDLDTAPGRGTTLTVRLPQKGGIE